MTKILSRWPKGIRTADEVLSVALDADPEFAAEWERLALARMVAARLIAYRSENGLSQRELAKRLGVSQPRVAELESGEKNPQIETLVKIAATTASSSRSTSFRPDWSPLLSAGHSRTRELTCTPADRFSSWPADPGARQLAPVSSRPEIRRATER